MKILFIIFIFITFLISNSLKEKTEQDHKEKDFANTLPLSNYKPNSIYQIPKIHIGKAKFPIIDVHSHAFAKNEKQITLLVKRKAFYKKFQDRLLYGTDMGFDRPMYEIIFRILESSDEHVYERDQFGYHWALNGFDLADEVLSKVYSQNAKRILRL